MTNYPVRKGYNERVWKVSYMMHGFKLTLLVRGTEPEMQDYLESEMGYVGSYYALNDDEVEMAKKLRMSVYCAPEL